MNPYQDFSQGPVCVDDFPMTCWSSTQWIKAMSKALSLWCRMATGSPSKTSDKTRLVPCSHRRISFSGCSWLPVAHGNPQPAQHAGSCSLCRTIFRVNQASKGKFLLCTMALILRSCSLLCSLHGQAPGQSASVSCM